MNNFFEADIWTNFKTIFLTFFGVDSILKKTSEDKHLKQVLYFNRCKFLFRKLYLLQFVEVFLDLGSIPKLARISY